MDSFLGEPFDVAEYALLTYMVAKECGLQVGELIQSIGDAHIYNNHVDQVNELLKREPYEMPKLWLNPNVKKIDDYTMDDIKLIDYKHHKSIKASVAV